MLDLGCVRWDEKVLTRSGGAHDLGSEVQISELLHAHHLPDCSQRLSAVQNRVDLQARRPPLIKKWSTAVYLIAEDAEFSAHSDALSFIRQGSCCLKPLAVQMLKTL